jgi:Porin subfamily
MNSVKCLLMGSAAGLMAVSAAQAADLPVKAAPVEYVKVCDIYGAGFWYVPGTDTCMKIGTWVRAQFSYGGSEGSPAGWQGPLLQGAGFFNRDTTSTANDRVLGLVTVDARTQTEYGTLRSYVDVGMQSETWSTWPNNALTGGANTNSEGTINTQYQGNNIYNTRMFLQFAGFTAGRIRSLYDIIAPGAYTLSGQKSMADTAGTGIVSLAYTSQFANGISLSLALEDPGMIPGRGGRSVVDMSRAYWAGGTCNPPATGQTNPVQGNSGFGTCVGGGGVNPNSGQTNDLSGDNFWNPVANLRIDQSWGFAAISGAMQNVSAGYYNNAINSTNTAMADTLAQGHPGDTYGYAGSFGFTLTDFLGLKGDSLSAQVNAGHGAVGYVFQTQGGFFQYAGGGNIAYGQTADAVYGNGTRTFLSNEWSAFAAYEHFWTPKIHSAWWGGLSGISYSQGAQNLICAGAPGFGIPNNSLGFSVPTATGAPSGWNNGWAPGSKCNPNFGLWQVGTRTIWNPHPDLDIGLDIMYSAIRTSMNGSTVWYQIPLFANGVGLPPGPYTFANEGQWTASLRLQRNFLP